PPPHPAERDPLLREMSASACGNVTTRRVTLRRRREALDRGSQPNSLSLSHTHTYAYTHTLTHIHTYIQTHRHTFALYLNQPITFTTEGIQIFLETIHTLTLKGTENVFSGRPA